MQRQRLAQAVVLTAAVLSSVVLGVVMTRSRLPSRPREPEGVEIASGQVRGRDPLPGKTPPRSPRAAPKTSLGSCGCCGTVIDCNGLSVCDNITVTITNAGACDGTYHAVYDEAVSTAVGYPVWIVDNLNGCPTPQTQSIAITCPGVSTYLEMFLYGFAFGPYPPSVPPVAGSPFYAKFDPIDLDQGNGAGCCAGETAATIELSCP